MTVTRASAAAARCATATVSSVQPEATTMIDTVAPGRSTARRRSRSRPTLRPSLWAMTPIATADPGMQASLAAEVGAEDPPLVLVLRGRPRLRAQRRERPLGVHEART